MPITYNTKRLNCSYVFRATSGGTVFSTNLVGTAFDYFLDSPSVDDAIYFSSNDAYSWAGVEIDVATAMAGTDIVLVWEYFCSSTNQWEAIEGIVDATNGLTTTGANLMIYFPYQFAWEYRNNVNGVVNIRFVRCRLDSFTTVTEGGANTSDTPQVGTGEIHVDGYTEGNPATLKIITDYMITNYPTAGCSNPDGMDIVYDWPNVKMGVGTGYWKMNKQVLLLGNGTVNGVSGFFMKYLQDGDKYNDYGTNGSTIIWRNYLGGSFLSTGAKTKMYGTTFMTNVYKKEIRGTIYNGYTPFAYLSMAYGEWLNISNYGLGLGYWTGAGLVMKNIFQSGSFAVYQPPRDDQSIENFHVFGDGFNFGLYSGSGTGEMVGLNWDTNVDLFTPYSLAAGTYNYNFLDPVPSFPALGDGYVNDSRPSITADWHIYEKYSLYINVIDVDGNAISGATVAVKDKNGDSANGSPATTDANGDTGLIKCTKSHGYYDEEVKKDDFNPFTLTISKPGYQTYTSELDMSEKKDLVIKLEKAVDLIFPRSGGKFINLDSANPQNDVLWK